MPTHTRQYAGFDAAKDNIDPMPLDSIARNRATCFCQPHRSLAHPLRSPLRRIARYWREATQLEFSPTRKGWLHVALGSLNLDGIEFGSGDGAAIEEESPLRLEGRDDAELVLFDLP